jgi:hypothetical protein
MQQSQRTQKRCCIVIYLIINIDLLNEENATESMFTEEMLHHNVEIDYYLWAEKNAT